MKYYVKPDRYNLTVKEYRPPTPKNDGTMTQARLVDYGHFGCWEDLINRVLRDEILVPDGDLETQLRGLRAEIAAAEKRILEDKNFFVFELGKGKK